MEMKAKLFFEEESLEMAKSGAVWGSVWFQVNSTSFPEKRWNDLVVALFVEVLLAARSVQGGSQSAEVRFYDGPYWIRLLRHEASVDLMLSTSNSQSSSASWTLAELGDFVNELEESSRVLVKACHDKGWSQQGDVQRLKSMVTTGNLSSDGLM